MLDIVCRESASELGIVVGWWAVCLELMCFISPKTHVPRESLDFIGWKWEGSEVNYQWNLFIL